MKKLILIILIIFSFQGMINFYDNTPVSYTPSWLIINNYFNNSLYNITYLNTQIGMPSWLIVDNYLNNSLYNISYLNTQIGMPAYMIQNGYINNSLYNLTYFNNLYSTSYLIQSGYLNNSLYNLTYFDLRYNFTYNPLWYNDSKYIYSNNSIANGNVNITGNLSITKNLIVSGNIKGNITCIGFMCMYQNSSNYSFISNPCNLGGNPCG